MEASFLTWTILQTKIKQKGPATWKSSKTAPPLVSPPVQESLLTRKQLLSSMERTAGRAKGPRVKRATESQRSISCLSSPRKAARSILSLRMKIQRLKEQKIKSWDNMYNLKRGWTISKKTFINAKTSCYTVRWMCCTKKLQFWARCLEQRNDCKTSSTTSHLFNN